LKQRNPRYGCPLIAQQINLARGLDLYKDIVRRILASRYSPDPRNHGPSWLTTLGHAKDSLWSVDLFRAESITLKTHWIMVVMDQYTRRIIAFAVNAGNVDGPALCRMFNSDVVNDLIRKAREIETIRQTQLFIGQEEWFRAAQTPLTTPYIINLKLDPFERFIHARGYDEWAENRSWILGPAGDKIAEFVKSFEEFPPTQRSFSAQVGSVSEYINSQAVNR
jgi:hypothetical protein